MGERYNITRLSVETLKAAAARWREESDPLGFPAQARGELLARELCPVCGQPDNRGDCDHSPRRRLD